MIKKITGIGGGINTANIVNTRFNKYMNPVIDCSFDADTLDNSQCFLNTAFETPDDYRALYTGANTEDYVYPPDGLTYNNVDQVFMAIKTKSNDVRSGWNKVLDVNGEPKPIFQPTFINGRFDKAQVWLRSVRLEGTTLKGWYVGDDGTPTFYYSIGYATSEDYGETWSRYSNDPIYEDGDSTSGRGIVIFRVLWDGAKYLAFYNYIDPNISGFHIAESTDGITNWTRTHTGLLSGTNIGFLGEVFKEDGVYYAYMQKNFQTGSNYGPARELYLYSSSDLTTWTSLGPQLQITGSNEFGVGPDGTILQKPNGDYFFIFSAAKNRTQALASNTKEASTFIKIAESTSKIQNSSPTFEFPDYVAFHAPLGSETGIVDLVGSDSGTLSGSIGWAEYQMIRLNGSQVVTFLNSGLINGSSFGIKMRIEIITTGNRELFKIGDDILMTIESGKLRVRLSSDGAGYEKDYITTVNIAKPTGLDYIDNHIYVGFIWSGGVLKMYNDFVRFDDATEITKTVDDSLTTVNNSGANILIGQNAAIEVRSVSILSGMTDNEFIELEI